MCGAIPWWQRGEGASHVTSHAGVARACVAWWGVACAWHDGRGGARVALRYLACALCTGDGPCQRAANAHLRSLACALCTRVGSYYEPAPVHKAHSRYTSATCAASLPGMDVRYGCAQLYHHANKRLMCQLINQPLANHYVVALSADRTRAPVPDRTLRFPCHGTCMCRHMS